MESSRVSPGADARLRQCRRGGGASATRDDVFAAESFALARSETFAGALVSVDGITVDSSIAEPVRALLLAAESDGVSLAGSGHRSAEAQIELRRAHCGTSHYAVFDMPAEACSPPTARPGQSMHERGLAIDFTCAGRLVRRDDRCYGWLSAHAVGFGLSNLPSEPWHWSVNGR